MLQTITGLTEGAADFVLNFVPCGMECLLPDGLRQYARHKERYSLLHCVSLTPFTLKARYATACLGFVVTSEMKMTYKPFWQLQQIPFSVFSSPLCSY